MKKHISGYSIYKKDIEQRTKVNTNKNLFMKFPEKKYQILYADPPWKYRGTQYDRSSIKDININFEKPIFLSSASFKYPILSLDELKQLNVRSICDENSCLLFLWTTGPMLNDSIELGKSWGFEYKTVAFVWDKQVHNPGRYTLSQTEFVLVFKKGKIPQPRGARNIRQLVSIHRGEHSEKPLFIAKCITQMFPTQEKIELFARQKNEGWDVWGLESDFDSNEANNIKSRKDLKQVSIIEKLENEINK